MKKIFLSVFIISLSSCNSAKNEDQNFAKCLSDSGAVFYGTEWCPHCKEQKEMFGDDIKEIRYVDCDKNKNFCDKEKIEAYPTWKFKDGSFLRGKRELKDLSEKTGCKLPNNDEK